MPNEQNNKCSDRSWGWRLAQVLFCMGVAGSSAVIFYWPDLLFLAYGVLAVGVIIFALLAAVVPDLRWNIIVVVLFWSLLYGLGLGRCQGWPEVHSYLTDPSNVIPIVTAIAIHVPCQAVLFLLMQKTRDV